MLCSQAFHGLVLSEVLGASVRLSVREGSLEKEFLELTRGLSADSCHDVRSLCEDVMWPGYCGRNGLDVEALLVLKCPFVSQFYPS